MVDTISACLDPRLARQQRIFHWCRLPLVIALGALVYTTGRATVDCFSSPAREVVISESGQFDVETAERIPSPTPAIAISSPGCPETKTYTLVPEAGTAGTDPDPVGQNQPRHPPIAGSESQLPPAITRGAVGPGLRKFEVGNKNVPSAVLTSILRQVSIGPSEVKVNTPVKLSSSEKASPGFRTAIQTSIGRRLNVRTSELLHRLAAECGRIAHQFAGTCQERWVYCTGRIAAIEKVVQEASAQLQAGNKGTRLSASSAASYAVEEAPRASHAEGLVLLNPANTSGTVLYLLNGQIHSLRPGEKQDLPQSFSWRIQFHRGGDFGDADYLLRNGTYSFQITANGWNIFQTRD